MLKRGIDCSLVVLLDRVRIPRALNIGLAVGVSRSRTGGCAVATAAAGTTSLTLTPKGFGIRRLRIDSGSNRQRDSAER